jgi:hypothetical protein
MNLPDNTHPNPNQVPQTQATNPGTVPGIILLVVGLLGILINGYFAFSFYSASSNEDKIAQAQVEMEKVFEDQKKEMDGEQKKQYDEMTSMILDNFPVYIKRGMMVCLAFLVLAGLTALGGFGLMKGSKGMGIIGSLAAMIPQSCCIFGLPIGIWGLFASMKIGKS